MTYEKMNTAQDTTHAAQAQKVIRCTPENAAEMRDLVKRWPELHDLVQSLQAQGLFPGLRGLQITLTGEKEWVERGLGAVMAKSPPNAFKAKTPEATYAA